MRAVRAAIDGVVACHLLILQATIEIVRSSATVGGIGLLLGIELDDERLLVIATRIDAALTTTRVEVAARGKDRHLVVKDDRLVVVLVVGGRLRLLVELCSRVRRKRDRSCHGLAQLLGRAVALLDASRACHLPSGAPVGTCGDGLGTA